MEYLFSLLCLGSSKLALSYLEKGNLKPEVLDANTIKLGTEINTFSVELNQKNNYILDLTVPKREDYSENEILTADGILFFTNPADEADYTFLIEQLSYIFSLPRPIPVVVLVYNPNGIIAMPTNKILEKIWKNTLYEAYICTKFSKVNLIEILSVLCESLATNTMIMNPEFAWMRVPVLIEQANTLIYNQNYGLAAKYVELLSIIGKRFQMANYLIWVEQAAWLYLQSQDYINGINLLKTYNVKKAKIKQEEYVKILVQQGNILYRSKNYLAAAQKYDFAAKWASFELNNPELYKKIVKSALLTYISANAFEKVFASLEPFDNEEIRNLLTEIGPNLVKAIDALISAKMYDTAKIQIYLMISVYQKYSIFDFNEQIASMLASVLYPIFEREIAREDPHSAKLVLDEILNVWETYKVARKNLDSSLIELGILFLNINDYKMVDTLYPLIEKKEKQKELEHLRMKHEEEVKMNKVQIKINIQKSIKDGLDNYSKKENEYFNGVLTEIFAITDKLNELKEYQHSLDILGYYLKAFRRYQNPVIKSELNVKKWDAMIQNGMLSDFIKELGKIDPTVRIPYLKKSMDMIIESLKNYFKDKNQDTAFNVANNIMNVYRSDLMYEEAKEITSFLVNKRAELLEKDSGKKDELKIARCIENIREIKYICDSYLDSKYPNMDNSFKNIAEFFIEKRNLLEARRYAEKIEDHKTCEQMVDRIQELDQERQSSMTDKIKEQQLLNLKLDRFSIIRRMSDVAKNEKEANLRIRNTLRRLFETGLNCILNKELEKAQQEYFETAKKLIGLRRYEASAISLSVGFLINIVLKDYNKIDRDMDDYQKEISSIEKIFEDVFSYKLICFAYDMLKAKLIPQLIESLKLFYNLPLFEEEEIILKSIIENDDLASEIETKDTRSESVSSKVSHLVSKMKNMKDALDQRESIHARNIITIKELFTKGRYEELYQIYLKVVQDHPKKREIGSTALCLARIIMMRELRGNYEKGFEKWIFKNEESYSFLKRLPEQLITEYFVQQFLSNSNFEIRKKIIDTLIKNLPLFEFEIQLLESFKVEGLETEIADVDGDKMHSQDPNSLITLRIGQFTAFINQNQEKFKDLKESRNVMRSQYYNDIIDQITNKNFEEASIKYQNLAKRFVRRSNFELATLMVLLSGMCMIKNKVDLKKMETEKDKFLDDLGLAKSAIESHEFFKILRLYIHLLTYDPDATNGLLKLISAMPILDEEMMLFQFP